MICRSETSNSLFNSADYISMTSIEGILSDFIFLINSYSLGQLKDIFKKHIGYEPCKSFYRNHDIESRRKIVFTELVHQLCFTLNKSESEIREILSQLSTTP